MALAVVKCGGAAIARERFRLDRWVERGERALVVHGAGPRISAALAAAGIESRFAGGRRVTTAAALPVVREAMRRENAELCDCIGSRAVPLLGDELGLEAERVPELGLVGIPIPTAPPRLRHLLAAGSVPVVAPLAKGPLNVNADDAAAALAIALAADRLVFVSDVEGVQVGGATVATLDEAAAEAHRDDLNGGILPKLQAAFEAARAGIDVRIGRTQVTC